MSEELHRWLTPNPNLPDPQRKVAQACKDLADAMREVLPSCAETTAGLRKLLEAKDCFVRASLTLDGPA